MLINGKIQFGFLVFWDFFFPPRNGEYLQALFLSFTSGKLMCMSVLQTGFSLLKEKAQT